MKLHTTHHHVYHQGLWCLWLKDELGNKILRAYGETKVLCSDRAKIIIEALNEIEIPESHQNAKT